MVSGITRYYTVLNGTLVLLYNCSTTMVPWFYFTTFVIQSSTWCSHEFDLVTRHSLDYIINKVILAAIMQWAVVTSTNIKTELFSDLRYTDFAEQTLNWVWSNLMTHSMYSLIILIDGILGLQEKVSRLRCEPLLHSLTMRNSVP